MDILASFMEQCTVIDYTEQEPVPANKLFNLYLLWAQQNKEYQMTSRRFYLEIVKKVPQKVRISIGVCYKGIRLNDYANQLLAQKEPAKNYSINDFKE